MCSTRKPTWHEINDSSVLYKLTLSEAVELVSGLQISLISESSLDVNTFLITDFSFNLMQCISLINLTCRWKALRVNKQSALLITL